MIDVGEERVHLRRRIALGGRVTLGKRRRLPLLPLGRRRWLSHGLDHHRRNHRLGDGLRRILADFVLLCDVVAIILHGTFVFLVLSLHFLKRLCESQ
jgi:hypothetical protein